jgi:hypothetical protein
MKKIILVLSFCLFTFFSFSQCINGTENSSVAAINDGYVQNLSTNVETFEYVTVTNIIPGDQYVFTNFHTDNGTIVHEYITIRNSSNVLIVSGNSPLTTSAISVPTIRLHISVDAACNDDLFFHTVTNVNLSKVTCNKPESPGISYKSNNRIDFYWSPPAYSTPIDYDWEIVPSGNAQGVGVIVSGSTGGVNNASSGNVLNVSTSYSIFVRSNCDTDGNSIYLGPLNFTTNANSPPANDFCSGAITLLEETGKANAAAATPTAGTLLGGAGTDVNAESCGGNTGNARDDVWYKFVAQSTNAHITVEPSPNFDVVVTLYSGDCNTLSYLACSDANISSPSSEEINYTGLSIGNTYYTRTYYFGTTTPATPTFNIKIWTPGTATDVDGDGFSDDVDCDDNNASIYPGAPEIVGNGIDENCDGMFQWYQDSDGDGYGSTIVVQSGNSSPGAGESNNSTDCNDGNALINPGATDIVGNGIDENCDGMFQWYQDSDGDGYGSTIVVQSGNSSPGSGESSNSTDCDDSDINVNPSVAEIPNNGIDDDCNPLTLDNTLAVDEFNLENIKIFPNPFNHSISIRLPLGFQNHVFDIQLYDLNGRIIIKTSASTVNGLITIKDLDHLDQGVYFIKISNVKEGQSEVRQLVKYK